MFYLVAMITVTDRNINIKEPFTVAVLMLHLQMYPLKTSMK